MHRKAMKATWIVGAAAIAVLGVSAPADAQVVSEERVNRDSLRVHQVRRGDTLWDLSRQYLRDPLRWSEIFQLNRDVVANPHWIYPAERLRIPILAARDATAGPASSWSEQLVEEDRTIFFVPETRTSTEHRLRLAQLAPAVTVTRGDYLRAGFVSSDGLIAPVGRLAELISPSIVPLRIAPQIQIYDRVYMTIAQPGTVEAGDRFLLVREGRWIRPYGRIFNTTGVASVAEINGDVATVVIEEMYGVVSVGDGALPMPQFGVPAGVRASSSAGLEGQIIAFQSEHALKNIEDIAYLDLGSASGVVEGDEFVAILPAVQRAWGVRPEIEVARLRVIRAADRTAAVRVIGLEQPALQAGLPVRLVAKMP
ncbi:LysM domain-containing protein [soil metagenome]